MSRGGVMAKVAGARGAAPAARARACGMDGARLTWWPIAGGGGFVLAGCGRHGPQSMLDPAGPEAETVADLWWFLLWVCTAVFVLTVALLAAAMLRHLPRAERAPAPPLGVGFIFASGVALPTLVLLSILFYSLHATVGLRAEPTNLTISVIGHQWWWEVRYPEQGIVTANELHIPAGEAVRIELISADVAHSFWVPRLGGKMDLLPEHRNVLTLRANEPGVYRGQCAEFCGLQHAWMAFRVVALPREEFDEWVRAKRQPPPLARTPEHERGRQVFLTAGCVDCHTIRGTSAVEEIGPDLTHIGSRLTIGAGRLPNTDAALMGWISNPQTLKPGVLMPRSYLDPDDLHALAAYLRSLE